MNLTRKFLVIALLGLLTMAAACSFNVSTANISELKMGKYRGLKRQSNSWGQARRPLPSTSPITVGPQESISLKP